MKKTFVLTVTVLLLLLLVSGCSESLPKDHNFGGKNYTLYDQNGKEVKFPALTHGKLAVVGYIFTNCPDICPLTTNNMRMVREELLNAGIDDVEYVTISFDPETDTPGVLKKYAELRQIDTPDWHFLTGDREVIDPLMREAGIVAAVGDSTVTTSGETIYYYIHTDRISLVDGDGYVRKDYKGSELNINELVTDIKNLGD